MYTKSVVKITELFNRVRYKCHVTLLHFVHVFPCNGLIRFCKQVCAHNRITSIPIYLFFSTSDEDDFHDVGI